MKCRNSHLLNQNLDDRSIVNIFTTIYSISKVTLQRTTYFG